MTKTIEPCVHCKESTAFGQGKFVNRIPSDDGYACAECAGFECDECGKQIYLDTEVSVENTGECFKYHAECHKIVKARNAKSMRWKRAQCAKDKWRFAFTIVETDGNKTDCTMAGNGWKQDAMDLAGQAHPNMNLEGFVFSILYVDGRDGGV